MSESKETQPAMTYPSMSQYETWKARAESMGMSVSEYMKAMIEAGQKKFDAATEPDETRLHLRDERNELKVELERARERIAQLEGELETTEREEIIQFLRKQDGATEDEIVQRIGETVPRRVRRHLDAMEGVELAKTGDEFEVQEGGE